MRTCFLIVSLLGLLIAPALADVSAKKRRNVEKEVAGKGPSAKEAHMSVGSDDEFEFKEQAKGRDASEKAEEDNGPRNDLSVGIDLGTTNTCASVFINGQPEVVRNLQNEKTTPSYIAFISDNLRKFGDPVKRNIQSYEHPLYDIKRIIGRAMSDKEMPDILKRLTFPVESSPSGGLQIRLTYKDGSKPTVVTPEAVSGLLLAHMYEVVNARYPGRIKNVIITCPAYFNDKQRAATKKAGALAGFDVIRIITEPTAAALEFGYGVKSVGPKKVLVFDLGGGTFDVSVLHIEDGLFEVKEMGGDMNLGGRDFDNNVVDYFADEFQKEHGMDIRKHKTALLRMRNAVEAAKMELSVETVSDVVVENIMPNIDLNKKLTRSLFEQLNMKLFTKCISHVREVMGRAHLTPKDVDDVLLIGGSTRIIKVQQMLEKEFGKKPNNTRDPDEAVALGAAIQCSIVNQEEATTGLLVIDKTPITYGIETVGGVMSSIVPHSSTIPITLSKIFTTYADNQTRVGIKVFQGMRSMTKDCQSIGEFFVEGIPPAPRGVPQIVVRFHIDVNGIIKVQAWDKNQPEPDLDAPPDRNTLHISRENLELKEEELRQMKEDAKRFAEEDRRAREAAEAHNELENEIYSLKRLFDDPSKTKTLPAADIKTCKDKLAEVQSWLEGRHGSALKQDYEDKKAEMMKVISPITTKLHGAPEGGAPQKAEDEDMDEDQEGL